MSVQTPAGESAAPWTAEVVSWGDGGGRVALQRDEGRVVTAEVSRCARGRLRLAYPVAAHDVEVRLPALVSTDDLTAVLRSVVGAVRRVNPECRKVLFAVERTTDAETTNAESTNAESASATIAAAEAAGFRYVVDVDLAEAELGLMVAEPEWVTAVDIDLDRVPGT
ncbi:hypothetical protein DW322_15345 [Rhodococcus rhodnii]|uniref:Uncharacterized protein n=2 Tax=Rhodococcus rhodnii TaxID=38312 RepID=R7WWM4_9NOCA|nr:hypothetical protein [Rhodococcus rhodnii]EOM78544.1 hypothetical protein Rrhod_0082 [Rhodococcus rhodnii LMG 5362]TXG91332.1 hypothetical protein DW322_15345 [Rhodococcus rhodnii]